MSKYAEFMSKQEKEFNDFTNEHMFFAFNQKQFDEGMAKLGLKPTDTDKIYSGFAGGFYKKEDASKIDAIFKKQRQELKDMLKDEDFAYDAFYSELANHEYCITYDPDEAFSALGVTAKKVSSDDILSKAYLRAKKDYLEDIERSN